jgi:hypothetical protein
VNCFVHFGTCNVLIQFFSHLKAPVNFTSHSSRHIAISSSEYRHIASENAAKGSSELTTELGEVIGVTFPEISGVENGTGIEADIGVASTEIADTGTGIGIGAGAGTGVGTGAGTGVL